MAVSGVSGSSGTSSSTSSSSTSTIAGNFDQFLLLLTTQLKTNDTLSSLLSLSAASTATNAVGFIGATITADGATTRLANGAASWKLNASTAGTATVTIKDANGNVVQTMTRSLVAGDQTLNWDGSTSIGSAAPDGQYTVSVDGRSVAGEAITVKTQISGVVDGVDFTSSIPALKIGGISVPIDQVKSVVRGE